METNKKKDNEKYCTSKEIYLKLGKIVFYYYLAGFRISLGNFC